MRSKRNVRPKHRLRGAPFSQRFGGGTVGISLEADIIPDRKRPGVLRGVPRTGALEESTNRKKR